MNLLQIAILAFIQGMAELLPVSSSAHVIVAEKLMGIDPTSPAMTFMLVMLHTGTMFAVLFYFWPRWKKIWQTASFISLVKSIVVATILTGVVGYGLKGVIEHAVLGGGGAQIEELFGNLTLISVSLFAAGVLIFIAGKKAASGSELGSNPESVPSELTTKQAVWIGIVQGLCLPFRGFSRSGATISTGLLTGVRRMLSEDFSFALAVVLTPPVIVRELWRLQKAHELQDTFHAGVLMPGLIGMFFSAIAGFLALRWLSRWMERGKWHWFGYYCIAASVVVFCLEIR